MYLAYYFFKNNSLITVQAYRNWESGRSKPRTVNIRFLAENLGVSFDEFLNGPLTEGKKKGTKTEDFPQVDPRFFQQVHSLTGIREEWSTSHFLGLRIGVTGPLPLHHYHIVYLDTDEYEHLQMPYGCEIIFLDQDAEEKRKPDDLILVYSEEFGPEIIKRSEKVESQSYLGKKLKVTYRESNINRLPRNPKHRG